MHMLVLLAAHDRPRGDELPHLFLQLVSQLVVGALELNVLGYDTHVLRRHRIASSQDLGADHRLRNLKPEVIRGSLPGLPDLVDEGLVWVRALL